MAGTGSVEIGFPRLRYVFTMAICDGRVSVDGAITAPLALDRVFAEGTLDTEGQGTMP